MALEPITRQEKIIAGQDLTPITRMEKFLKNFGGGGGGSVPKPLTYDYMPEGYPKKTMGTVTVMEEQELAFAAAGSSYFTVLPSLLDIIEGQTYTVKWDGTEHECVCSILNGEILVLGNLSIIGMGRDTGEPFCYASVEDGFITFDTSASHTISVKTTAEAITPIDEKYLPTIPADKLPEIPATKLPIISFVMVSNTGNTATCNTTYKDAVNLAMNGNIRAFLTDNKNYYYCVSVSKGNNTAYGGDCLIFKFVMESFNTANTFTTKTRYAILQKTNHVTVIW